MHVVRVTALANERKMIKFAKEELGVSFQAIVKNSDKSPKEYRFDLKLMHYLTK